MVQDVFIVSACRTAIGNYYLFKIALIYLCILIFLGSFQGSFERTPASVLGSVVIEEAISRSKLSSEDVNEVIMGHVSFHMQINLFK